MVLQICILIFTKVNLCGSTGLPFLGETLEFFARSPSLDLAPFFKRRLERYGPIFKTRLVGHDIIVSLDPEFSCLVLQQEKSFVPWYPESFMRLLGSDNILTCPGPVHKLTRNLLLRVFGPDNLRLQLLHEVERAAHTNLASWLDRPSVDLKKSISSMICSVTVKWLLGHEAAASSGEILKHYDAFIKGIVAFPINIPGTAFYKCLKGREWVMNFLKQQLDEKRKKMGSQEKTDLMELLIRDLEVEKQGLTEEYVLNLLFSLLFASFETTSTALTVALKFLMDNPDALQELMVEHEKILKARTDPDSGITWEEYKSMKFTSHVIYEGLRLANVAVAMFRKATHDISVKGFTVPEGRTVMIYPSANHLNPVTYNDPRVFNPRRWKDISEPSGGSKDFIAFGRGPRFCPGSEFAKLQMAIFLHCLITKYRWTLVSGGNMVLSPAPEFPNGFHVQVLPK